MADRTLKIVLHYDGGAFAGWQRQPEQRTVQGVVEEALQRLCNSPIRVTGSGRTDAGVHAHGQSAGITIPDRWTAATLRRALNAVLPDDVWAARCDEMQPEFHARYSAIRRRYSYVIGTDDASHSPFRRRFEWPMTRDLDQDLLHRAATQLLGRHVFRAFAVHGTAPLDDDHSCDIASATWTARGPHLDFQIAANRFLHHMVRFLVGTMVDIGTGKRPLDDLTALLQATDNHGVSPPAPPNGLYLEEVEYPATLYMPAR